MYVDSVSDAMLKGLGEQISSMKINILDALISLSAVFFLVPRIGIWGYIVAIYISETFNTFASLYRAVKITGVRLPILRYVILPLVCAIVSSKLTALLYSALPRISSAFMSILGGLVFLFLYVLILKASGTVNREESSWIRSVLFGKLKIQ